MIGDRRATVAVHAETERLRPVPIPFPATITVERRAAGNARVSFRGNFYSVPPELAHTAVRVSTRLGEGRLDIATTAGIVVARHQLAADGTGAVVADHGHVTALNTAALTAFNGVQRRLSTPIQTTHPARVGCAGRGRCAAR